MCTVGEIRPFHIIAPLARQMFSKRVAWADQLITSSFTTVMLPCESRVAARKLEVSFTEPACFKLDDRKVQQPTTKRTVADS